MPHHKDPRLLEKMLRYVLGRHPEEFGLVPDPEGYVRVRDLLQALHEEEGWGWVRAGHLQEAAWNRPESAIEVGPLGVRARRREDLPRPQPALDLPKLLYVAVRRRVHAALLAHGLAPTPEHPRLVLAFDPAMAQRLGRRRDPSPLLVTVHTACARAAGVALQRIGDHLVLSGHLPLECLSVPPLPKVRETAPPPDERPRPRAPLPGSVLLDVEDLARGPAGPRPPGRDREAWKRDRRRSRRHKERLRSGEG
jgi:putative RNA 2'-phosphotransferase